MKVEQPNGTKVAQAMATSPDGRSEATRTLGEFLGWLDSGKSAIKRVVLENDALREQVGGLERQVITTQTACSSVRADNTTLRGRVEKLEAELRLARDQVAGLELEQEAVGVAQQENTSLQELLTAETARAAALEERLTTMQQAGAQFAALFGPKQA